jgi:serine/threonine-protein kinase
VNRLTKSRFLKVIPIQKIYPEVPHSIMTVVKKAMEIDPEKRYQSPKELLIDLEVAQRTLSEPDPMQLLQQDDDTVIEDEESRASRRLIPQRSVMFVESDSKMQNLLRDHLKSRGFRVLMTGDPQRALDRFKADNPPAQCLVFSTVGVGESAVEVYEQFITDPLTAAVPAILMLGKEHQRWANRTDGREYHVVLQMPITLGDFREVLDRLVPHALV